MTAMDCRTSNLLLAVSALALICTPATAFETAVTDGSVNIAGKADPDELLRFEASFQMQLPVKDSQYQYETSISVPQKPNRFTIRVQNVQDLNAGVKMGFWLTKHFEALSGVATLSQSNIPPGRYNLKIFGQAQEGSSRVPVDVSMETEVKANKSGDYSLTIDTAGMPSGQYAIRGAGQTKTIKVGQAASSPDSRRGGLLNWLGSYF